MRRLLRWITALGLPLLTGGCWSGHELTDWGFVQAAAIDLTDDGAIRMTTQIYKPTGGTELGSPSKGGQTYVNTDTISSSLFGASEDIAIELGRRPQWSHLQVLLIGEKAAGAMNIRRFTDFFWRRAAGDGVDAGHQRRGRRVSGAAAVNRKDNRAAVPKHGGERVEVYGQNERLHVIGAHDPIDDAV